MTRAGPAALECCPLVTIYSHLGPGLFPTPALHRGFLGAAPGGPCAQKARPSSHIPPATPVTGRYTDSVAIYSHPENPRDLLVRKTPGKKGPQQVHAPRAYILPSLLVGPPSTSDQGGGSAQPLSRLRGPSMLRCSGPHGVQRGRLGPVPPRAPKHAQGRTGFLPQPSSQRFSPGAGARPQCPGPAPERKLPPLLPNAHLEAATQPERKPQGKMSSAVPPGARARPRPPRPALRYPGLVRPSGLRTLHFTPRGGRAGVTPREGRPRAVCT